MPTELSWTELRRGATDLRSLLAFRRSGLRSTRGLRIGAAVVATLSVAAVVVPAYLREPLDGRRAGDLVAVLPSLYLGFAVLTVLAAISSGGGREVVPREQAVAFPVSSVTEHLGALLLAPLNIAWLLQAWTLLTTTTYVTGPDRLVLVVVPLLLWIAAATALGQCAGWAFEGLRRSHHARLLTRGLAALVGTGFLLLVLTDRLVPLLDRSPTVEVYLGAAAGSAGAWGDWAVRVLVLATLLLGAVVLGLLPARWALSRPLREELRLESGHRRPVPNPRSDLGAMVRVDRSSVWRAVPLRRGLAVLALMPGTVALAGQLTWDLVTVLPGLVASGAALLFGVNAWCLDGRGALWRDSLPVAPRTAFTSKVVVLLEVLLGSGTLTLLLAAGRAGVPTAAQLAAVVMTMLVVAVQVTAAALQWSVESPYAVDLRSARATPAPPVVMAGYSARLALRTTMVGLVFSGASYASAWQLPVLLAVPMLCWSTYRLRRTALAWDQPVVRSRVVAVAAG